MQLRSALGRKEVYALAFGAMIGWSWVVLSGSLARQAGTLGSILAFLLGALLVGFVGLTYAELTSAMPRAGGEVAFTYRALNPTLSWVCGWALILAYVGVCAFEAVAIAAVLDYLIPGFQAGVLYEVAGSPVSVSSVGAGMLAGFCIGWINWRGVQISGRVQWLATASLLLVGLSFFVGSNLFGSTSNLPPTFTTLGGILRVAILTPFLLIGFDVIPQASEEMKISHREIGRIMLLSIGMASAWYMLVQWGVGLSLPPEVRQTSSLATADAAAAVWGHPGAAMVLVLGGLLGILTSWNAFFVGASRLLYSMGRSGMLPPAFGNLHAVHSTPSRGVVFVTVLTLVAPFFGRAALLWIANASSLAAVVAFFLVSVSFVRLRRLEPGMSRPYRVRNGQLVGAGAVVVSFGFILLYFPPSPSALLWPQEWAIVLGWGLLGILIFLRARSRGLDREQQRQIVLGE